MGYVYQGNFSNVLARGLEESLAASGISGKLVSLNLPNMAADAPPKFLLRDPNGNATGFVLCSAWRAPELIGRGVTRAEQARYALGPDLGQVILHSLASGQIEAPPGTAPDGSKCGGGRLTYTALPFRTPVSSNRIVRYFQRRSLRPSLFKWLREATIKTAHDGPSDAKSAFSAALCEASKLELAPDAAANALRQLDSHQWKPKFVLAHNDLWIGNILRDASNARFPFVIIDWLGSAADGFAIFDLIRIAESSGLPQRELRSEIDAHCQILDCTHEQAGYYLLAALGHVALNLEEFPWVRFEKMAKSCWRTFTGACAR